MPPRHIAMVSVQVRDFGRQTGWYVDVMGCTIGALEPGEFCTLAFPEGDTVLALACDHPEQLEQRAGSRWRPNIFVDDLDAALQRLEGHGVEIVADDVEGEDEGYRLAVIADPEGNHLGLFSYG